MIAKGDLVVAPPNSQDREFRNSVIVLTDHSRSGTMGLVLNRSTDVTLNELLVPLDLALPWQHQLYWGGPVAQDMIFMLHSSEWSIKGNTHRIDRNWSYTTHWQMFHHLADNDEPQHWRVFAGCAAWAPHQLVSEITSPNPRLSWLVINKPASQGLLDQDGDALWSWSTSRATEQAVSALMA